MCNLLNLILQSLRKFSRKQKFRNFSSITGNPSFIRFAGKLNRCDVADHYERSDSRVPESYTSLIRNGYNQRTSGMHWYLARYANQRLNTVDAEPSLMHGSTQPRLNLRLGSRRRRSRRRHRLTCVSLHNPRSVLGDLRDFVADPRRKLIYRLNWTNGNLMLQHDEYITYPRALRFSSTLNKQSIYE